MGSVNLYIACIFTGSFCGLILAALNSYLLQKRVHAFIPKFNEIFFSAGGDIILPAFENIFQQIAGNEKTGNFKRDVLNHFDAFMQDKLADALPALKMFIDDELIAELKKIFRTEMDAVLPVLLKKNMLTAVEKSALLKKMETDAKDTLQKKLNLALKKQIAPAIIKNIFTSCIAGGFTGAVIAFVFQLF